MDIKGIIYAILCGTYDSVRGMTALFHVDRELNKRKKQSSPNTTIRRRESDISRESTPTKISKQEDEPALMTLILKLSVFNGGIFLMSVLLFEFLILPLINIMIVSTFGEDIMMSNKYWELTKTLLTIFYQTTWVLPLLLLSKIVNCLWFQDIADKAYKYSRGRPLINQSISRIVADSIFSILVQVLFLLQATIVELIPLYIVGKILGLVHMCLLYSLYTFEYKWFNMGWELHRRLSFIETNWPYFIGFGLPLAFVTQMSSSWVINGCIFALLFPWFIVSGNEANPVTNSSQYPLHLFSPVIALSNALFNKTIGTRFQKRKVNNTPTHVRR
ncbi:PREDICTED: etoposide-induced protein 2.4 homolog isoform X2 [Nicrophorus vespilloides]|uniref:Etoposide-induced protein 2.4 homolog isoform X2 n=1 Tax=Nicrophorus vespilloides TaxID=110193 RepID=A0ABM1MC93_NICVS|nr:PREDICTED: etoposide-induced protein 2.4 homolog isoform X2 [Nicrophorus vespilloides]